MDLIRSGYVETALGTCFKSELFRENYLGKTTGTNRNRYNYKEPTGEPTTRNLLVNLDRNLNNNNTSPDDDDRGGDKSQCSLKFTDVNNCGGTGR